MFRALVVNWKTNFLWYFGSALGCRPVSNRFNRNHN